MMSREFSLETTLKVWDFIFCGINEEMLAAAQAQETANIDYDALLKQP